MNQPGAAKPAAGTEPRPVRTLGLTSATMIVIGVVIGSGIFVVSPEIARQVGSPGMLMLAWALTAIITVTGALCYGELAAAMPQAGGQYVYLRESLGPLFGFLYGWTAFLVIQTGTIAAVCMAFGKYLGVLEPAWISEQRWLFHVGHWGPVQLGVNTVELAAIVVIVFLTWLNSRGLQAGALVQNVFTVAKIAALAGLIVAGLALARRPELANFGHFWSQFWGGLVGHGRYNLTGAAGGAVVGTASIVAVLAAMVGSLFSSDAWNNITFTAGEVSRPRRNVPLALAIGTLTVSGLYILVNLAYLNVLPFSTLAQVPEDRVASAMLGALYGHTGAVLIAAAILIATFGCTNGLILAGARVYYAMARDGLFFAGAGELNRAQVPGRGLWIQGAWAALLCLSGTYTELLNYVMFAVFLFYILTITGLFVLRRRRPEMERPYKAVGYPVMPGLYMLLAAGFDAAVLWVFPQYAGGGLLLVLAGVPVYYLWRRRRASMMPV